MARSNGFGRQNLDFVASRLHSFGRPLLVTPGQPKLGSAKTASKSGESRMERCAGAGHELAADGGPVCTLCLSFWLGLDGSRLQGERCRG